MQYLKRTITTKNQVVIVTGGAAGIGGAITTELVQRGASVGAVDISDEEGKEIAKTNPDRIAFLKADISRASVAKDAIQLALSNLENYRASQQRPRLNAKAVARTHPG